MATTLKTIILLLTTIQVMSKLTKQHASVNQNQKDTYPTQLALLEYFSADLYEPKHENKF
jgi:hypothetical protein